MDTDPPGVRVTGNSTVAALFVDPNGVYAGLEGVEVWDEARDARLYDGPWPVVAHPPCQRWCQLAPLNESRLGDGYRVGDDAGWFEAALRAVRTWGGVLEHPALSLAWREFHLPRPGTHGWTRSFDDDGYTTEIAQVAYGHAARKRTWLYYIGRTPPPSLRWTEPVATARVSEFGRTRDRAYRWTSAQGLNEGRSSYTPAAFRDVLLGMARTAQARSAA